MNARAIFVLFVISTSSLLGYAGAEEIDAVIDDPGRSFTKIHRERDDPASFTYGRLKLDSKGRVVGKTYLTGLITPQTKVVQGKLDEKSQTWGAGEPIEGGVESSLFKTKGKVLRVAVFTTDDKKSIERIVVKNADEKLEFADKEFHAIFKQIGRHNGYAHTIWYVRQELDDQGKVVKTFGLTSGAVLKETKIAMGKYNEQTKKWKAGDPIEKGLEADIFKDLGIKPVHVYMVPRSDKRGLAELLVTRIGD